jgi:ketosteroid isomerase-like protein
LPDADIVDRLVLIEIANAIDNAVDAKDWERARSYFDDDVRADFSSLSGQSATVISSDALVDAWRTNLKPSKTSLHLRTNHVVTIDGNTAVLVSHGFAWNRMEGNGDPLWETWGTYEHRFRRTTTGWKVNGFTYVQMHERGNMWVKTTVPER